NPIGLATEQLALQVVPKGLAPLLGLVRANFLQPVLSLGGVAQPVVRQRQQGPILGDALTGIGGDGLLEAVEGFLVTSGSVKDGPACAQNARTPFLQPRWIVRHRMLGQGERTSVVLDGVGALRAD